MLTHIFNVFTTYKSKELGLWRALLMHVLLFIKYHGEKYENVFSDHFLYRKPWAPNLPLAALDPL